MNDRNTPPQRAADAHHSIERRPTEGQPVEGRLRALRPQPLRLDAQALIAQAQAQAQVQDTMGAGNPSPAGAEQAVSPERAPQPPSHRASGGWSLLAVGVSGFAAGVLLTMWVLWPADPPQLTAAVPSPPMEVQESGGEATEVQEPGLEATEVPQRPGVATDAVSPRPAADILGVWKTDSPTVLAAGGVREQRPASFSNPRRDGHRPAASLALRGASQEPAQSSDRIRVGNLDGELLNELLFGL
ncbi:hypothetical protein [Roseimaritima sediminicola]|uniref:hypothetical protein n=1 Tax=Roseimaritima sediminicola TaxID=2662066 RepID=UPI0012985701|nr:hypothetical protein [Roseimaritima sediminicola]